MRSTGKSAHKRERGRRYGGSRPTGGGWKCNARDYSQIRWIFVVIPSGVEESLEVSDCTSVTEIVRDVSTSLDMTNCRNVALVYFCAIGSVFAQVPSPSPEKSMVYAIHDADAIAGYETNSRAVRAMVDRLVLAVTGQPDVGRAWGSLVAPNDKIGIKISAAGGELFTTHHDVVTAVVEGLRAPDPPPTRL